MVALGSHWAAGLSRRLTTGYFPVTNIVRAGGAGGGEIEISLVKVTTLAPT